jgi:hypothetical protein
VVPLTVNAIAGQTADLLQLQVNGATKHLVTKDGNLTTNNITAANTAITSAATGTRGLLVKGMAAQSADILAVQDSSSADLLKVSPTGVLTGTYLQAGAGVGLIGGAGLTALSSQTLFPSGNPALEVRSTVGGAGTYKDLLQIRHPQFDGTAVLRRLGVQLKLGDEVAGDVSKAGGMYLESSAASAANPSLVLFQADAAAITIPSGTGQITFNSRGQILQDVLDINKTGSASIRLNTDVQLGDQANSAYMRVGSTSDSMYFYAGGVHSDTPAAPGAGGSTMASLSGAGLWTSARVMATSTASAAPAQANPAFLVGTSGATNLIADGSGIQARNGLSVATLALNGGGGDVNIGATGTTVNVIGTAFKLNGTRVYVQAAATTPSSPSTGDLWLQNG